MKQILFFCSILLTLGLSSCGISQKSVVTPRMELNLSNVVVPNREGMQLDSMPVFQGKPGPAAFRQWVARQVKYPVEVQRNRVQGRVTIVFIVDADGNIRETQIMESPHPLLSDEVRRILLSSPQWTPGYKDGHPVRVLLALPIDFKFSGPAYDLLPPNSGRSGAEPRRF